jgi:hypothetical protein
MTILDLPEQLFCILKNNEAGEAGVGSITCGKLGEVALAWSSEALLRAAVGSSLACVNFPRWHLILSLLQAEVERLLEGRDAELLGICLDPTFQGRLNDSDSGDRLTQLPTFVPLTVQSVRTALDSMVLELPDQPKGLDQLLESWSRGRIPELVDLLIVIDSGWGRVFTLLAAMGPGSEIEESTAGFFELAFLPLRKTLWPYLRREFGQGLDEQALDALRSKYFADPKFPSVLCVAAMLDQAGSETAAHEGRVKPDQVAGRDKAGFVYILLNPSIEGLLKIGRTARDPQERVRELSAATGVATPFILAYQMHFADCEAAELFVHAYLEGKGFRVSADREFFKAPLPAAIDALLEARQSLPDSQSDENVLGVYQRLCTPGDKAEPWRGVFEMAEAAHYGLGETLHDDEEAFDLYLKAARLGCPLAHINLGQMARNGEGTRQDARASLAFFRDGTSAGDERCFAEMARTYEGLGETENAEKCWNKYFASNDFQTNAKADDYPNRTNYMTMYMRSHFRYGSWDWYRPEFRPLSKETLPVLNRLLDHLYRKAPPNYLQNAKELTSIKKAIESYDQWTRNQQWAQQQARARQGEKKSWLSRLLGG